MNIFPSLFFSCVITFALGSSTKSLRAQEAAETPRNAVIVIRHAEDAELPGPKWGVPANQKPDAEWPSEAWKAVSPNWPEYFHGFALIGNEGNIIESGSGVTVSSHALSGKWKADGRDGLKMKGGKEEPLGEAQAVSLGNHLDAFLSQANFAGINRAITMNPQVSGATPNPFDTLWPYLNKKDESKADLYLVECKAGQDKAPGIMAMIPRETETELEKALLNPNGGSTIICWTGEGLAGKDGILDKLVTKYRGEGKYTAYNWDKVFIERCAVIYVFYRKSDGEGVAERWRFNSKSGEFTREEGHPNRD